MTEGNGIAAAMIDRFAEADRARMALLDAQLREGKDDEPRRCFGCGLAKRDCDCRWQSMRSSGAGGGHRTGPVTNAARSNAASEGKRLAAQDGGDAAPAGIAGEPRGAAGPGHHPPTPEVPMPVPEKPCPECGSLSFRHKKGCSKPPRRSAKPPKEAVKAARKAHVAGTLEALGLTPERMRATEAIDGARKSDGSGFDFSFSTDLSVADLVAIRDAALMELCRRRDRARTEANEIERAIGDAA